MSPASTHLGIKLSVIGRFRWYSDRPEVKAWQDETIRLAHEQEATRTLMGMDSPPIDRLRGLCRSDQLLALS